MYAMSRNAKLGLILCAVLIVILGLFNVWFYKDLQEQRNLKSDLQRSLFNAILQKDTLENALTSLNTTHQNYVSTHSYSNSEYEDYVANHQYTNWEYQEYVADHLYTNSEHESYVVTHQCTNEEYADYVTNHLYTNEAYNEACYSFYYVKPEEQKFGVYNLDDELGALEWTEPYQAGVFDCSEMSACLEWFLENKGWHVKIYRGDTPFGAGTHAWLIVETTQGKYMPVESTTLRVVWWSDPHFDGYWEYENRFETIQDALAYSENQYDWWELGYSPLEHS